MGKRRRSELLGALLLLQIVGLVAAKTTNSSTWKTLSGNKPAIIARGGFSGTFPDSSANAYSFAQIASSSDTILYCDLQLTKDSVAICLPSVILNNCTDIANIYPKGSTKYDINDVETTGWFSIDYTSKQLNQVALTQPIWSRTPVFDYSQFPILSVNDLVSQLKPPSLWLNAQHDKFFTQHNLSVRSSIISLSKSDIITHVSSPEISLLQSLSNRLPNSTSLIFRFLSPSSLLEPSHNHSYSALLNNLTYVKSFADGILVPKTYIWPVGEDNYLTEHTGLVDKAHKAGLEIYAADLANDNLFSYNYSYDPIEEILGFVDNGEFSVDGVMSDYPITPSEAIGCFTNLNKSTNDHGKPLIISHNGASGDYPDCTDLAYQKAVDDGADVIDCTVQVTRDGTLICMSSISLIGITTVLQSQFSSQISKIPALQSTPGIFTFNLTWTDISKELKPLISQPLSLFAIKRNPRYANKGSFFKLSDFLDFAKDKDLDGILLSLENVAFVNQELGFDILTSVKTALTEAGYTNSTSLKVNIQSTDSSVLTKLASQNPNKYSFIYKITELIRDASQGSLADIKKFADAVAIDKESVYPTDQAFLTNITDVVARFQKNGLKVYVFTFMNEFLSQAWDFFSDATVEINTFVQGANIDGIITDFPKTARRYKRSSCLNMGNNTPAYAGPVQAGGLLELIIPQAQPPATAPYPVLSAADVSEPALPPVSSNSSLNKNSTNNASGPPSPMPSDAARTVVSVFVMVLLVVLLPVLV
ncbi:hypothetical protein LUZ60_003344 [Juncus effusus]|nr:hypothetical protein LUZ60_003344 [Juncus effusus]